MVDTCIIIAIITMITIIIITLHWTKSLVGSHYFWIIFKIKTKSHICNH